MAQVEARKPELEQVVPGFTLPSLQGSQVSPRDYKQTHNLVIACLDLDRCGRCADLLREFADNYHVYRDLETEILVVCPQSISDLRARVGNLGLPFPVLSDERGEVGRVYLSGAPSPEPIGGIFVADRFGALRTQIMPQGEGEFPSQATILDWLTLVELECPECGVSEWPT